MGRFCLGMLFFLTLSTFCVFGNLHLGDLESFSQSDLECLYYELQDGLMTEFPFMYSDVCGYFSKDYSGGLPVDMALQCCKLESSPKNKVLLLMVMQDVFDWYEKHDVIVNSCEEIEVLIEKIIRQVIKLTKSIQGRKLKKRLLFLFGVLTITVTFFLKSRKRRKQASPQLSVDRIVPTVEDDFAIKEGHLLMEVHGGGETLVRETAREEEVIEDPVLVYESLLSVQDYRAWREELLGGPKSYIPSEEDESIVVEASEQADKGKVLKRLGAGLAIGGAITGLALLVRRRKEERDGFRPMLFSGGYRPFPGHALSVV